MQYEQDTLFTKVLAYIAHCLGFFPRNKFIEKKKVFWEEIDYFEKNMLKNKYLTGDTMTLADISAGISLSLPMVYLGNNCYRNHPKLNQWHQRLRKECPEFNDQYEKYRKATKPLTFAFVRLILRFLTWVKT